MFAIGPATILLLNFIELNFPHNYDSILFSLIIAGGAIAAAAFVLGLLIFLYSSAGTIFDLLVAYRNRKAAHITGAQDEGANRVR